MTNPLLTPWITVDDLAFTPDDQMSWATARIREYCNWHIFPPIEQTLQVDTNGERELVLPTLRLTGLGPVITHTVAIGDDEVASVTDVTVDPAVLSVRDYGTVQRLDWGRWPYTPGTVTVTFTHGYDALPEALRNVAVALALRAPRQMSGMAIQTVGGESVRYDPHAGTGFYGWELSVLNAYQIPPTP